MARSASRSFASPSSASRSFASSALSSVGSATPTRLVAVAVAGSALAAAGQLALSQALPAAAEGANVLRLGLDELLTPGVPVAQAVAAPLVAEPLAAVAPVAPEPQVVGAADLVKAAEVQRVAAEQAARAAEEARLAEEARVAAEAVAAQSAAQSVVASAAGGVQMLVGRITSGFGARWGSSHQGLDIAAPIGTPIHVPLAGTVISSGPASGFGQWVRVEHADGTVTVYGHISRSHVRVGQSVAAGDVIADVGNEGQSTGPHLHFEVVTPGGTKVNPRPWLDEHGIGLT
ncbi:M23 family metallopeptidase [Pseudonocardia broussonetiae]|uniref:M23 family metallopeptidase n=1 Tax=Pseudonocardia broussonetiae TaxID=2736640 RepID=UPI001F033226|nr:M23 family metallopeptidase [Pseudonocardia broussonetiae]